MPAAERAPLYWPFGEAADAVLALARSAGLDPRPAPIPAVPSEAAQGELSAMGAWIDAVAAAIGVEAQGVSASYRELDTLLRGAGPCLIAVPGHGLVAVLAQRRRTLVVVGTDLRTHHRSISWLGDALRSAIEAPHHAAISSLLARVEVTGRGLKRALPRLLSQRLASERFEGCWMLRIPPGGALFRQAGQQGLLRSAFCLVAAHLVDYGCTLLSFAVLAQGVLSGRIDVGWLSGCLLLLLTIIPLHVLSTVHEERLATRGGVLLKQRLLDGVLRSADDPLRPSGVGRFLAQVLESETLEGFVASGGLALFLTLLEVMLGAALLSATPSRALLLPLYFGFCALCGALSVRFHRRRRRWTADRLILTEQLIESMIGHRTRLVQEPPARWYKQEDQLLAQYLDSSQALDAAALWLGAGFGRGWLLLGFLGTLPMWVTGPAHVSELALVLWTLLLTSRALSQLGRGLQQLSSAIIAWQQLQPLARAADTTNERPTVTQRWEGRALVSNSAPVPPSQTAPAAARPTLLSAQELYHSPPARAQPVLRGCNLQLRAGDRILLEGPSGGGKSTLAAVLAGLRSPDAGLILSGGLDLPTLGLHGFRRRVVLAPQYHQNHVFSGSLAFNLLLARPWPPTAADMAMAQTLCEELGLGPLLARMPAGLHQMMGETGWRLSQGERSRLFLIRALLQAADVVILDESLAALDPQTLILVARCVMKRCKALVLIAHP